MSEKYWWSIYGSFRCWKDCPSRPDSGDVLLFYLEKREIMPEEHVPYLMNILGLQKSMAYNVLKGGGVDTISRCRLLVQVLRIHPPLLGIDARYYPIERHPYWWHQYGFFFNADAQGYPVTSEVVAHLRIQRTHIDEEGRVKVWSQEDLGDATGLRKEAEYRMEHHKHPQVLESMSRRAIVASALGQLSGDNEPIIFRLFGLDPQAYNVPVPAHESILEVHFLPERLTDEILKGYHQQQAAFFTEYYTSDAQNTVGDILEWLRRLAALLPLTTTTAQRVQILAIQCRYHGLMVVIACEQRKTNVIMFHADKAVTIAEQVMSLPNLKLDDHSFLVITNELLAAALLRRANAYYELGHYELAQTDIDRALSLLPALQSNQLKIHILADAGLIHAHTAKSEMDRTLVLSYFGLATQLDAPSQLCQESNVPDDNFILCGTGMLYLRKAMALSAPKMKGSTAEKLTDLLEEAQRFTVPEFIRQQTLIGVFRTWAYIAEGDYQQATETALLALEKSRQIRSRLNRDRIEEIYQQLLRTSLGDRPLLAYLSVKLRTWDHGMV